MEGIVLVIGVYFTNTADIESQKELLRELLDSPKRFVLKLVDLEKYA